MGLTNTLTRAVANIAFPKYNLLAYFLPLPKNLLAKAPSATQTLLRRFTGSPPSKGDAALQQIAQNSLQWSENFGGKQDIEAFAYRLALGTILSLLGRWLADGHARAEWARILNDDSQDFVYRIARDA